MVVPFEVCSSSSSYSSSFIYLLLLLFYGIDRLCSVLDFLFYFFLGGGAFRIIFFLCFLGFYGW